MNIWILNFSNNVICSEVLFLGSIIDYLWEWTQFVHIESSYNWEQVYYFKYFIEII